MINIRTIVLSGSLFSGLLFAILSQAEGNKESFNRNNIDIVIPPEVWPQGNTGSNNHHPCLECCVYQNQSYSQGAVINITGEILQCVRDKNMAGTHTLIWKVLSKQNKAAD